MLRIKIVVAIAAITVMLMGFAAPAMAAGMPLDTPADDSTAVKFSGLTFCELHPELCVVYETPITQIPDPDPGPWEEQQSFLF
jgi:hypothetical protein